MSFPLGIWDLSLFTAMMSIILLSATALLSSRRGKINLLINKKKLRNAAMVVSLLFLATVLIRIASLV
jgi:hypothetical protein